MFVKLDNYRIDPYETSFALVFSVITCMSGRERCDGQATGYYQHDRAWTCDSLIYEVIMTQKARHGFISVMNFSGCVFSSIRV